MSLAVLALATLTLGGLLNAPPPSVVAYKETPHGVLRLYVFEAVRPPAGGAAPAVVWIHGGGWTGGTCESLFPLARYTAVRGAVSLVVEYRLVKPGAVSIADCIADCRSAVRYVRGHAAEWGVDPRRVAVVGESAGGHLAAAVAMLAGGDAPGDDLKVSARPDALVLYNPLVDFTGTRFLNVLPKPIDVRAYSPLAHVRPGLPPTITIHGLADTVVDPDQSRRLAAALRAAGNACDLVFLPDIPHAFLIPNYKCSEQVVVDALKHADDFLARLGWFTGPFPLRPSTPPAWPAGLRAKSPAGRP